MDDAQLEFYVDSYGKGDPGELGFIPNMAMLAIRTESTTRSEGGIALLGKSADEAVTPRALVLAVGPDVKWFKIGDRVYFGANAMGNKIYRRGGNFALIREDQLFGKDDGVGLDNSEYIRNKTQSGNT